MVARFPEKTCWSFEMRESNGRGVGGGNVCNPLEMRMGGGGLQQVPLYRTGDKTGILDLEWKERQRSAVSLPTCFSG